MQVLLPVGCCRFMGRPRHRSMRREWRREILRPYNTFLEPQMCVSGGVNVGQTVHKPWCICLIVNDEMMWQGFVGVQYFFIWYILFLPNLRPLHSPNLWLQLTTWLFTHDNNATLLSFGSVYNPTPTPTSAPRSHCKQKHHPAWLCRTFQNNKNGWQTHPLHH